LFEGTPAQMVDSLSKLRALPDNTRVWCAHEYTLKNLQFALTVDQENLDLQTRYTEVQEARRRLEATIPSQLGIEKRTNHSSLPSKRQNPYRHLRGCEA
jgi:hydroxyacylglutathione hydrolase